MSLKLLIHIPDDTRAKVGLKMAQNFLKTAREGEELRVRVLFNAQGVIILLNEDEEFDSLLAGVAEKGGEIYFCENALRAFGVSREKLPSLAHTVPAGIRALVEWQEEGFRYVRA